MAQETHTCLTCGRERTVKFLERVALVAGGQYAGEGGWRCRARSSCKAARRRLR